MSRFTRAFLKTSALSVNLISRQPQPRRLSCDGSQLNFQKFQLTLLTVCTQFAGPGVLFFGMAMLFICIVFSFLFEKSRQQTTIHIKISNFNIYISWCTTFQGMQCLYLIKISFMYVLGMWLISQWRDAPFATLMVIFSLFLNMEVSFTTILLLYLIPFHSRLSFFFLLLIVLFCVFCLSFVSGYKMLSMFSNNFGFTWASLFRWVCQK